MSIETDFRALMASSPAVTSFTADRIAQDAVPEGSKRPLLVFSVRHEPIYAMDGTVVADQASISVQAWADSAAQAAELADAITAQLALAPVARAARVVERASTFDPDLGLDGVVMTVEWWA